MNERVFGRRSATLDVQTPRPESGDYVRRNRLFSQVATTQFGVAAFALSWGLPYLFHLSHGPQLGLAIVVLQFVLYGYFRFVNRNVLVVDDKFVRASLADKSVIAPIVGLAMMWIIVVLFVLMVIGGQQDPESIGAFTLVMCIWIFSTMTRRAVKTIQKAAHSAGP
jgi:hypothetical protein